MAVVFISPKQRQKTFFMGITIVFSLFLIAFSFGVFLSKPKEVPEQLVFNKPKINIDMKVFDSEQFKALKPFIQMETQYSYKAYTKSNQIQTGFITAVSQDLAKQMLTSIGLSVTELKEVQIGRDNPFTPYYYEAPIAGTASFAVTSN